MFCCIFSYTNHRKQKGEGGPRALELLREKNYWMLGIWSYILTLLVYEYLVIMVHLRIRFALCLSRIMLTPETCRLQECKHHVLSPCWKALLPVRTMPVTCSEAFLNNTCGGDVNGTCLAVACCLISFLFSLLRFLLILLHYFLHSELC